MTEVRYVGNLEYVTVDRVCGWLRNDSAPHVPCHVDLYVDDGFVGTYAADRYQPQLDGSNGRSKFCYFEIPIHGLGSADTVIDVRIAGTRVSLPNAPVRTCHDRALIDTALMHLRPETAELCRTAFTEARNPRPEPEEAALPAFTAPSPTLSQAGVPVSAFLEHQYRRLRGHTKYHLQTPADLFDFLLETVSEFNVHPDTRIPLPPPLVALLAAGRTDADGVYRSDFCRRFLERRARTPGPEMPGPDSDPDSAARGLKDFFDWVFHESRLPLAVFPAESRAYLNAAGRDDPSGMALSRFYELLLADSPNLAGALGAPVGARDGCRGLRTLFPALFLATMWLVRHRLTGLFVGREVERLLDRPILHDGTTFTGLAYFCHRIGIPAAPGLTLAALAAPRPRPAAAVRAEDGVNLYGFFGDRTGLSRAAIATRDLLRRAGIPFTQPVLPPSRGIEVLRPFPVNLCHFGFIGVPGDMISFGMERFAGLRNVGVFFWETDTLPEMARLTLAVMDEIWVLSDYCARVFRKAFAGPVHVVPTLLDIAPPAGGPAAGAGTEEPDRVFRFYFCFDALSTYTRKNPLGVVEAFRRAFPDDPGVALTIKVRNSPDRPSPRNALELHRIRALMAGDPRIGLVDVDESYEGSIRRMAGCDCYVSLHRSEGFGYTMAEAMALDKPVIASGYSGNLDFMDDANAFLVGGAERYIGQDEYVDVPAGSRWFEPDTAHAAALMRLVRERPDEARERGRRGGEQVRRLFSADRVAEVYRRRIAESCRAWREGRG
ncbi:glycosyltransferase [Azospirillum sp. RWY-5-1]|uniref:Glycosyltransferase n=1 Tax=Azospirillum oleiclasticum TaxID=2735135 RepID=A0ABX2TKZ9_9PROT|nr:glycosyltransferase [Azospirillum oleiclasticum]NYZ17834.1 glycosyltransferase [Azospirillum oleiclasticum]NYZ25034.1 glycosyltransferase [Azospirillum oleiclasticum]